MYNNISAMIVSVRQGIAGVEYNTQKVLFEYLDLVNPMHSTAATRCGNYVYKQLTDTFGVAQGSTWKTVGWLLNKTRIALSPPSPWNAAHGDAGWYVVDTFATVLGMEALSNIVGDQGYVISLEPYAVDARLADRVENATRCLVIVRCQTRGRLCVVVFDKTVKVATIVDSQGQKHKQLLSLPGWDFVDFVWQRKVNNTSRWTEGDPLAGNDQRVVWSLLWVHMLAVRPGWDQKRCEKLMDALAVMGGIDQDQGTTGLAELLTNYRWQLDVYTG
jgi:hypothetical protein